MGKIGGSWLLLCLPISLSGEQGKSPARLSDSSQQALGATPEGEGEGKHGAWRLWEATGYSYGRAGGRSCGATNTLTASGTIPEASYSIAAWKEELPFGTELLLSYKGVITKVRVEDTGRLITKGKIDIYMLDCARALRWGRQKVWGKVVKWGDGRRSFPK